ncbi:DM13 domain-containing protein [Agreia sp.]|uniref:DM13 domain-containing protein n=1 Tax=Agreia sp. TaxID=1872416 RepID=UPI0035BC2F50
MKRAVLVTGGMVAAAALIVGLIVLQPWLLFTDVRVDDALPTTHRSQPAVTQEPVATSDPGASATPTPEPTPDPVPVALSSGSFVSQEHSTTGTATIIENPDGTRVLAIENLDTSNGPDVHVWLSAADAVEGYDGWFLAGGAPYVDLGVITGNQGNQVYEIPTDVDLSAYRSVSLWCVQFSVGFGAAQLR